jgi:hypothetical protein
MILHIPSLAALELRDDGRLGAELRLGRLRAQAAVVRALGDQVEHVSRARDADALGAQLVEEIARLVCEVFEAGSLATAPCLEGHNGRSSDGSMSLDALARAAHTLSPGA